MALEDDIATLARAPLFSLMDYDALRLVAFAGEHRGLRSGDMLFRKGDTSDGGFVVTKGAVALETSAVLRVSPTLMRRVLQEFPVAADAMHRALSIELSKLCGGLERVRKRLLEVDEARAS